MRPTNSQHEAVHGLLFAHGALGLVLVRGLCALLCCHLAVVGLLCKLSGLVNKILVLKVVLLGLAVEDRVLPEGHGLRGIGAEEVLHAKAPLCRPRNVRHCH